MKDRSDILAKLIELKKLQRMLEDLSLELEVGDITEDKIFIAIKTYQSVMNKMLREGFNAGEDSEQ